MPANRNTAAEAYAAAQADTLALLRRIEAELASAQRSAPASLNWGHVGEALERRRALTDISDRLFQEGEYAPAPPSSARQEIRAR